jgi:hypothetical protein
MERLMDSELVRPVVLGVTVHGGCRIRSNRPLQRLVSRPSSSLTAMLCTVISVSEGGQINVQNGEGYSPHFSISHLGRRARGACECGDTVRVCIPVGFDWTPVLASKLAPNPFLRGRNSVCLPCSTLHP